MEYRTLPGTDITVSVLAQGCWSFAGDAFWGPQDDRDSIATVHAALDAGINLFDTAESYGDGYSEEILGKAIENRRREAVIATKFSSGKGTSADVEAACERSLRRLRTDYIDLYQIHWPFRETPLSETVGACEQLQQQGKIRAFGVCNFGIQDLKALPATARCVSDQIVYSLLARNIEYEIQPACIERDIGILCYMPLAQGLLTGRYANADEVPAERAISRHFAGDRQGVRHGQPGCEQEVFTAVTRIREIAGSVGESMPTLALAWVRQQAGVTSLLVGARTLAELHSNMRGAVLRLDEQALQELNEATARVKEIMGADADLWTRGGQTRMR